MAQSIKIWIKIFSFSLFFFCIYMCKFSSSFLKRLFYLHWIAFASLSKLSWPDVCVSLMDFLFYFIALSDFPPRPRSLNYNCFIIIYRWSTSSNFIILLKTYFVASGSFHFPMNFRFSSSIYTKKKKSGFWLGLL